MASQVGGVAERRRDYGYLYAQRVSHPFRNTLAGDRGATDVAHNQPGALIPEL